MEFANATLMRTNYSDTGSLALLLEKLSEARPILALYWVLVTLVIVTDKASADDTSSKFPSVWRYEVELRPGQGDVHVRDGGRERHLRATCDDNSRFSPARY